MIIWTERAHDRLTAYCEAIRAALSTQSDVDADEVVVDVRAHIESELADRRDPVTEQELDRVLEVLGEPERWAGVKPTPACSPAELGASGLALALAVAGITVEPLLLFAAYAVARFRLARGDAHGAERWLLYPPVILGDLAAALFVMFWPFGMSVAFGGPGGFVDELPAVLAALPPEGTVEYWLRILNWASVVLGVWWIVLGATISRWPGPVSWLLRPFTEGPGRRTTRALMATGAIVVIVATLLLL